jgi:hypothetical protein
MSKMQKVKIETIIKSYKLDSLQHEKNKPTNSLIVSMLENATIDSLQVEFARGGGIYNRGSVVECLTRAVANEYINGRVASLYKKSTNEEDFNTNKKNAQYVRELGLEPNTNYEIKLITSLARASMSTKVVNPCIVIDLRAKTLGVYLVQPKDLVIYNGSSIKDYNNGVALSLLSELLGL